MKFRITFGLDHLERKMLLFFLRFWLNIFIFAVLAENTISYFARKCSFTIFEMKCIFVILREDVILRFCIIILRFWQKISFEFCRKYDFSVCRESMFWDFAEIAIWCFYEKMWLFNLQKIRFGISWKICFGSFVRKYIFWFWPKK